MKPLFQPCVEPSPLKGFLLFSLFSEFDLKLLFHQWVLYLANITCSAFKCLVSYFLFLINPVTYPLKINVEISGF